MYDFAQAVGYSRDVFERAVLFWDTLRQRADDMIAHERAGDSPRADFLPDLQRELIEVISKYVAVNPDDIKVQLEKQDNYEVLEVNIVLPEQNR